MDVVEYIYRAISVEEAMRKEEMGYERI